MIQLNLIPDVKEKYLKTQRTKRIITFTALGVTAGFVGILVLFGLSVYVFQRQHLSNLDNDIDSGLNEFNSIKDIDKILTIQNQLIALPPLHEEEPETSRLFSILNNVVPKDISVSNVELGFATGESGFEEILSISGEGKDFKTVNKFVDTLKNAEYDYRNSGASKRDLPKAFETVVLETISRDESEAGNNRFGASYTVRAYYNPDIFNNTLKDLEVTVPNITSSVSSTERPSVFQEANNGR